MYLKSIDCICPIRKRLVPFRLAYCLAHSGISVPSVQLFTDDPGRRSGRLWAGLLPVREFNTDEQQQQQEEQKADNEQELLNDEKQTVEWWLELPTTSPHRLDSRSSRL
jgi:hypothetical protein